MFEDLEKRRIKSVKREALLRIEKTAGDGVCMAHDEDNKIVFVRYSLPGELIKVNVYKEAKDYAMAEPAEIREAAPERIEPHCSYFTMCGGCDMQMLGYDDQLTFKEEAIKDCFKRIGAIDLEITDVIRSPLQFNYRNTVTFKVHPKKKRIGFFRKDTKSIVDIEDCKIAMKNINTALADTKVQEHFPPHNFKVRTTDTDDTTVHWVQSDKYEDREVYETVNACGKPVKFKISKDSFFQINNSVIPLWLEKIVSFLDKDKHERIFDLYCGIGLITIFVSFYAKETIGVEIAKSSVKDARHNISINKVDTNIKIELSPVEEIIEKLGHADVVIVDPPRRGMDEKTINTLLEMAPAKIIYSSCKASTMARDIKTLSEKYEIKEAVIVDMFPQTHHVEMLCLLTRNTD